MTRRATGTRTRTDDKDKDKDKDHERGKEVPCDTDKLIQAIVFANNKHGGVLELAKGCTYNLTRNDYEGNGLPVITERITLKGEHTTISREATADYFRILNVGSRWSPHHQGPDHQGWPDPGAVQQRRAGGRLGGLLGLRGDRGAGEGGRPAEPGAHRAAGQPEGGPEGAPKVTPKAAPTAKAGVVTPLVE